ncbi:MAG TPA: M15 family metallopeptidase [Vicinamibacterales bacterium]|jgi:D-alanyl-D-alanine dipeptidase
MRKVLLVLVAAGLLLAAVASAQVAVPAEFPRRDAAEILDSDLVELVALDPTIHLDIRYATPNNLAGRPVYPEARALLQRPAAEALVRVNAALRKQGFGLLVYDGYRPWSVTKIFWDVTPPDKREFVADPTKGSKHNRGCAVDLSLYDLATGREAEMPSVYDEMSPRAYPTYTGGTDQQRIARDRLKAAMETEGFTVEPNEWWHFNYREWARYPILNIQFSEIVPRAAPR